MVSKGPKGFEDPLGFRKPLVNFDKGKNNLFN